MAPLDISLPAPALVRGPVPRRMTIVVSTSCRPGCGACCIAPSISSPIPGMPEGKPAGVRCVQLSDEGRCALFGDPARPQVCGNLQPSTEMCGGSSDEAMAWLAELERQTAP